MGRWREAPGGVRDRRRTPVAASGHAEVRRSPIRRKAIDPVGLRDACGTLLTPHGDGAVREAPGDAGGLRRAPDAPATDAEVPRRSSLWIAIPARCLRDL
jgi:hypothetical protein